MRSRAQHATEQQQRIDQLIYLGGQFLDSLKQIKKMDIADRSSLLVVLGEMVLDLAASVDKAGLIADKITKLP